MKNQIIHFCDPCQQGKKIRDEILKFFLKKHHNHFIECTLL